jgi:ribonucleotide monophosphatase NagD (HAD superfamily)
VIFTKSFRNIKNKTLLIDIDGTICTEEKTFDRPLAKPLPYAVEALKLLKKNGNIIILWTARGWEQYKITKKWLDQHGFVYDQIIMGKPIVDYIIDDRARKFIGWKRQNV